MDVVYLDCRKALDTVPHQPPLANLRGMSIQEKCHKWIHTFSEDRRQGVVLNDAFSRWRELWSRVPQGSVLGSVLFIVFVNDILDSLESSGQFFAGRAKIYSSLTSPNDREALRSDLEKLQEWSDK